MSFLIFLYFWADKWIYVTLTLETDKSFYFISSSYTRTMTILQRSVSRLHILIFLSFFFFSFMLTMVAMGQTRLELKDLSSFKSPGPSWRIVGEVNADLNKENQFSTENGTGILLNLPGKKAKGEDLFSNFEHGDMDLELEFMMAKGSNSGIYLQGRYEIQLLDSWGASTLSPGGNGGIYQRWDESKPEGQKGYQGYAPRQNVSRAPGLWQHLKVEFQAPRFDRGGKKIENAKLIKVELNGVVIHEMVELFGPTRGAISEKEAPKGPLRIQGDHGAVAFRNIRYNQYDQPRPELKDLSYKVYGGKYEIEPQYDSLPPEAEGTSGILSSSLKQLPLKFLLHFSGTLSIQNPGEYNFGLIASGGTGMIRINNQEIIPLGGWSNYKRASATLPKGDLPFQLIYSKFVDWETPTLGLTISGMGIREFLISDPEELQQNTAVDPIILSPQETPILRSFMDVPNGPRVTHAVSVGSTLNLHYTYDLDNGAIVQAWRGDFLDTTPMWHQRGDGSSRPRGAVYHFAEKPMLTVAKLASDKSEWKGDTLGTSYTPKGYVLDAEDQPTFRYQIYGSTIEDKISVSPDGKGLSRKFNVQNAAPDLYVLIAKGSEIESLGKNVYLVDNKKYYVQLEETGGAKPIVRNAGSQQELIIPLRDGLHYAILL